MQARGKSGHGGAELAIRDRPSRVDDSRGSVLPAVQHFRKEHKVFLSFKGRPLKLGHIPCRLQFSFVLHSSTLRVVEGPVTLDKGIGEVGGARKHVIYGFLENAAVYV